MQMDSERDETGNKCCETCVYHDDWTWACFNPDSDDRADFVNPRHGCSCWTIREDNNDKQRY